MFLLCEYRINLAQMEFPFTIICGIMFTILVCVGLSVCQPIQTWLSSQHYSRYVPRLSALNVMMGVNPLQWNDTVLHAVKSFCPVYGLELCYSLRKYLHVFYTWPCVWGRGGRVLQKESSGTCAEAVVSVHYPCQLLHLYCMLVDLWVECVLCIVLPVKIMYYFLMVIAYTVMMDLVVKCG